MFLDISNEEIKSTYVFVKETIINTPLFFQTLCHAAIFFQVSNATSNKKEIKNRKIRKIRNIMIYLYNKICCLSILNIS